MSALPDKTAQLTDLERRLLDAYQRGFPLTPTPFADIAEALAVQEADVLEAIERLQKQGVISRVGAIIKPRTVGASTLAAIEVPADRLEEVATLVSEYRGVNHNYEREHQLNLWFVATAIDDAALATMLLDIENRTGLKVHRLPMIEDYHIDLGFELKWP